MSNQYKLEQVVESLYDLDRSELRALAYEALLISDGPDAIKGSTDSSRLDVVAHDFHTPTGLDRVIGFTILPKEGQR